MTQFVICNQLLDVSASQLPTHQQQEVRWLDYIGANTSEPRWVPSMWFARFYDTQEEAQAVIDFLATLGIDGFLVAVENAP